MPRKTAGRRVGAALLAAGSSQRFGEADKLVQPFMGEALGERAAAAIPVDWCHNAWVIASQSDHPCEGVWIDCGFEPVVNPDAQTGMGTSVALAAALAGRAGCDALLIALADMPAVPAAHFRALVDLSMHPEEILVSARGEVRMPPAIFGKDHFAALSKANGDKGARDLLQQGQIVPCPPEWLIDIDTPEDLTKYGQ